MTEKYIEYPEPYGTYFTFHEDHAELVIEGIKTGSNLTKTGCFDPYWSEYRPEFFQFGFAFLPVWMEKVIQQFNETFENIQIEIVFSEEFRGHISKRHDVPEPNTKYYRFFRAESGEYFLKRMVFQIHFDPNYSETAVKFFRYVIHHYLRMFSYPEDYIEFGNAEPEDTMEFILDINSNTQSTYRSLADMKLTKEDFLIMDDIETANMKMEILSRRSGVPKQTLIFRTLKNPVEINKFKVDDYVRPNPITNVVYTITNTQMVLGQVVRSSYDEFHVKVLIHKTNPFAEGDSFTVNNAYFSLVERDEAEEILFQHNGGEKVS